MDGIEGVPPISAAPAIAASMIGPGRAAAPAETPGAEPRATSASRPDGQIRANRAGGSRFETLILAVQALRLGIGPEEARTDRVASMRAAAEEIFRIDGVPRLLEPAGALEAEPIHAESAPLAAEAVPAEGSPPAADPAAPEARALSAAPARTEPPG